jgi:hypothetical protein
VEGYCTCGAQLPPGARFCHKCGKPQGALVQPEPEPEPEAPITPAAAPDVTPPAAPPGISLRNPVAVRVAFLAGATSSLLIMLPMPPLIQILWQLVILVVGGFFAVWLYQRRTGRYLSVRSGAHLGWLAGTFCFLIMMVMFTLSVIAISSGEGLEQSFREMLNTRSAPEVADQFNRLLSSPGGVAALLFGMLLTSFIMLTILATVGGALGAKVLEKE